MAKDNAKLFAEFSAYGVLCVCSLLERLAYFDRPVRRGKAKFDPLRMRGAL
jgi:hypothetical protein